MIEFFLLVVWLTLVLKARAFRSARRLYQRIKTGKAIAARAVHFERILPAGHPRILIAGDSTAYGTGASDPGMSIAGYFGRDFPQATIRNVGRNGLRISGLTRQLSAVADERFDVCVILIGGNDVVHQSREALMRSGMVKSLEIAQSISSTTVLMTQGNISNAPIFPRFMAPFIRGRSQVVRRICMDAAAKAGVSYVDVFVERLADHWLRDPDRYYAADTFHPSEYGYADWYARIRAALPAEIIENHDQAG